MVLWRPIKPSRTNTQKWCLFHHKGLEWESRKSRDTWSNRQIWPLSTKWSTKWSRAKAKVLPRERTGHSKHPLPTTQEQTLHMDITRWSMPKSNWLYFFALIAEEGFLISPCYSLELCIQMGICFLFSLPLASFLFSAICKASSYNHFAFFHFFFLGMVLIPVSCTMPWTSSVVLQGLSLSDLIP